MAELYHEKSYQNFSLVNKLVTNLTLNLSLLLLLAYREYLGADPSKSLNP